MQAIAALHGLPSHDPECLVDLECPVPEPGPHDLLVRVEAIGVNPVDTKVRASLPAGGTTPRVLGWDGSGVVEAIGAAVTRFNVGEAVFFAGDITRAGCNAEFVLVDERITGRKPVNLSHAEAAALPLTSLTSWEALFERGGIDPDGAHRGRTLLILGAAGGVGSIAIQLAHRAGLTVIASASRPPSQAWVRQRGAGHVVNHCQPLRPQLVRCGYPNVDVIANFCDTDSYWNDMAELIRPQGTIVAIVGNRAPLDLNLLKAKSVRFVWEYMFTRTQFQTPDLAEQGAILDRMATLIESGELTTTLQQTLAPINATNLRQAHRLLESATTIGKLVLEGWQV